MRHIITTPPSADQTFPHKLNFALGKTFQSYFDRFFPITHVVVPEIPYTCWIHDSFAQIRHEMPITHCTGYRETFTCGLFIFGMQCDPIFKCKQNLRKNKNQIAILRWEKTSFSTSQVCKTVADVICAVGNKKNLILGPAWIEWKLHFNFICGDILFCRAVVIDCGTYFQMQVICHSKRGTGA